MITTFMLSGPVFAKTTYVTCGKIKQLPFKFIELTNMGINIIQVAVPVVLILMGGMDFIKATSSQNDDEIKKAQNMFIKRLLIGAIVYFVIVIVKLLISIVGNSDSIWGCVECFVSNPGNCK